MKPIVVLIAAIVLVSCHRHALPQSSSSVQQSDSVTVMYFYHDTVITHAPAIAAIHDTIPCPGLNYQHSVDSGGQHLSVTAKDGHLDVKCTADSLKQVIQLLSQKITEKQRIRTDSTVVVTKEVKVPVKSYPSILWWSLGINLLLGAGMYLSWSTGINGFFSGIGSFFSKLKF